MKNMRSRYTSVIVLLTLLFCVTTHTQQEKGEFEKSCEHAIQQGDLDNLQLLYHDAIQKLPTDERYEMERQRGNLLIYASYFGHVQVVRDLLVRGADPNAHSYYGSCALLYAIGRGYVALAQLLLEKGAHADSCNGYGESAVSIAKTFPVKVIRERMLDVLRMYGAIITEENSLF